MYQLIVLRIEQFNGEDINVPVSIITEIMNKKRC